MLFPVIGNTLRTLEKKTTTALVTD